MNLKSIYIFVILVVGTLDLFVRGENENAVDIQKGRHYIERNVRPGTAIKGRIIHTVLLFIKWCKWIEITYFKS